MAYKATVIKDSISPEGIRLTTFDVEFPRSILAEWNTHRAFSRNSASSRAIPIAKQLKKIVEEPFIPLYFGSNQPGMQAGPPLEGEALEFATQAWLDGAEKARSVAEHLLSLNVHKQTANRVLEPYMWHRVAVTSVDYKNFFTQRVSPLAQPEIDKIASLMTECYVRSVPTELNYGEWHTPYIRPEEYDEFSLEERKGVSAARCARTSYLTQDGVRDPAEDFKLYDRLTTAEPPHYSPLEHVATPWQNNLSVKGNFIEFVQDEYYDCYYPQGFAQLRHNL